jgi:hypothetical protein
MSLFTEDFPGYKNDMRSEDIPSDDEVETGLVAPVETVVPVRAGSEQGTLQYGSGTEFDAALDSELPEVTSPTPEERVEIPPGLIHRNPPRDEAEWDTLSESDCYADDTQGPPKRRCKAKPTV